MHQQRLNNQIAQLLQRLSDEHEGAMQPGESPQPTNDNEPEETIHVYFVREREEPQEAVVESTLATPQRPASAVPAATLLFCLLFPIAAILFQLSLAFNPPIATVTLMPKTKTVTLAGTLQLGRMVHPLTVSQSQTVLTTGTGHRDATAAAGLITFYNGLFTSQVIALGTILTGADGRQVITDQQADVPAANPPIFGQVTVAAHAITQGVQGNIPAYDINQACCANAVLAKNTIRFTGGANARNFSTVRKQDMNTVSTQLLPTLTQSMQAALQGQLTPQEQLHLLPCTPTITSDHQIGQEATTVTVTVSETCSAVAYNQSELAAKATALLSRQAAKTAGAAYSLFGAVRVSSIQATTTHTPAPLVFLSFHAQGTWVYGLTAKEQERIKSLLKGHTKQDALHILATLPGIASATLQWGDDTKLPKDTRTIQFLLIYRIYH